MTAFSVGITILNQRIILKEDIEFVTEFPCLLGHPVSFFARMIRLFNTHLFSYFINQELFYMFLFSIREREAVLRRSAVLKNSSIYITEDLSKAVRESRLNLNR